MVDFTECVFPHMLLLQYCERKREGMICLMTSAFIELCLECPQHFLQCVFTLTLGGDDVKPLASFPVALHIHLSSSPLPRSLCEIKLLLLQNAI